MTFNQAGLDIEMNIYPNLFTDNDAERQEKIILHELLHPALRSEDEGLVNHWVAVLWSAFEKRKKRE